jgi:hypothetical protein
LLETTEKTLSYRAKKGRMSTGNLYGRIVNVKITRKHLIRQQTTTMKSYQHLTTSLLVNEA